MGFGLDLKTQAKLDAPKKLAKIKSRILMRMKNFGIPPSSKSIFHVAQTATAAATETASLMTDGRCH